MSQILEPLRHYGLKKARDLFFKQAYSVDAMIEYYKNWRDDKNWMMGEKWSFDKPGSITSERVSWPLPKRGDQQYKDELRDKLSWIERLPTEGVFNPTDRNAIHETNFLLVTETTHVLDRFYTNREKNDIWRGDSPNWNRKITRLRQHYGPVYYLRSNEGTQRGNPAPHDILFFPEYTWRVRAMTNKKGKMTWRIFGEQYRELKDVLEGKDSRASPVPGFVDIQGIFNPRSALKHITKYCFGTWLDIEGQPARKTEIQELTYFWLWITRKHTYTSSRDFPIKVQVFLKVFSDSTQRLLGISKDVWVYLEVGTPEQAQIWDPDGIPNVKEIPWPGKGPPKKSYKVKEVSE